MSVKDLERDMWRLIEAARATVNPDRRRLLISEAFELMKEAKRLRNSTATADRSPGTYRLWFSQQDGGTLWADLAVTSLADALWAADALSAACADAYDEFELWQGTRYLLGGETRLSCFSLSTGVEVALASQRSVLDTEDTLLQSHRALARSGKLLAATERLRQQLASSAPH